jgi:hypothetical protein
MEEVCKFRRSSTPVGFENFSFICIRFGLLLKNDFGLEPLLDEFWQFLTRLLSERLPRIVYVILRDQVKLIAKYNKLHYYYEYSVNST